MKNMISIAFQCTLAVLLSITPQAMAQSAQCSPQVMGEVEILGTAGFEMLDDDTLIAVKDYNSDTELVLVDVSNPHAPTIRSTLAIPAAFHSLTGESFIAVKGDHIFISLKENFSNSMLSVIDATDRDNPVLNQQFDLDYAIHSIDVWSDALYMTSQPALFGSGYSRLIVYDITQPSNPTLLRSVNMGILIEGMKVDDGQLFVHTSERIYLHTIDQQGLNQWQSTLLFNEISGFDHQGDLAYACADDALQIIDYANATNPKVLSYIDIFDPQSVAVLDSIAYVTNGNNEIVTVDVTNPAAPYELGRILSNNNFAGVNQISGGFSLGDITGLKFYDENAVITNQPPAQNLTTIDSDTQDFAIYGDFALIVNEGEPSFSVVDISNPYAPQLVREVATTDNAHAIAVNSTHAYIAVGSGFDVFSLQSPRNPTWVATKRHFNVTNITVNGNRLATSTDYISSTNENGIIAIYNLQSPANPTIMGWTRLLIKPSEMEIRGNFLYATDRAPSTSPGPSQPYFKFAIIDISNPTAMFITDEYREDGPVISFGTPIETDMDISNGIAYVTRSSNRIMRFDVSRVYNIDVLPDISINTGDISKLDASDNLLAFNARSTLAEPGSIEPEVISTGLNLYDISDPMNPTPLNGAAGPINSDEPLLFNPSIVGNALIATVDQGGLWTVDISPCGASCPADLNDDGNLNFIDVTLFISAYSSQDPTADFNHDGDFDFFDITQFLSAYSIGCN